MIGLNTQCSDQAIKYVVIGMAARAKLLLVAIEELTEEFGIANFCNYKMTSIVLPVLGWTLGYLAVIG